MEKIMAAFQTNPATVPQEIVTKVGMAAGHVARIQQEYAMQAETENSTDGTGGPGEPGARRGRTGDRRAGHFDPGLQRGAERGGGRSGP